MNSAFLVSPDYEAHTPCTPAKISKAMSDSKQFVNEFIKA